MDIQPNRYISNQMVIGPTILKEVLTQVKKKQLHQLSDKMAPIIIDFGSQTIKAGYDVSQGAQLVFRPQVSKNRDPSRVQLPIKASINTSYDQLDFAKQNYKSLFQRNIVLHFSILEQCNDYIFSELIRPLKKVRSNLIISQPFANPIHCRQSVLQLLFQCYQVQNVMIGVDALFAYFFQIDCNIDRYQKQTALVIHMGANTIHQLAIIQGKVDYSSVRRVNIGGNQSFELFAKTILLKNPQLKNKLTYSFLRDIYQKFTCIAIDYKEQLRYFSKKYRMKDNTIYHNRIVEANKLIQQNLKFIEGIQIDFDTIIQIPEEEIKRKEEIRIRMAQKLRETIVRRKQMKKKMHQHELQTYVQLKQKYQEHDLGAHQEVVQLFGNHKAHQKLVKKIKGLQAKLGLVEEKTDQQKFSLIDIPDHELPPQKLKFKKMQMYQKKAMEQRRQKQRQRIQEEERMKNLRQNNPELYLQQLKEKYLAMSNKAKQRERLKAEMGNRKSKFNKRKMQVMARLAEEQFNEQMFQAQQEQIKEFAQQQDSDHYSQLQVMEAQLRQIDPEYQHNQKDQHHLKQSNQLFLYTDLIKCHQIYFDPQLIGVNQTDMIESLIHLIRPYSNQIKQKLLKNVVICGGGSQIKGLKQRVSRQLRKECPVEMQIQVKVGKGGSMGAFMGMQQIGRSQKQFLQKMSFRRQDFIQKGKIQFVSNPWSNPKPLV